MYFRNILNQIYNFKKKIGQYLALKKPRFNNHKFGFLHIGKTSGVSLLKFFTKLDDQNNQNVPTWFSHEWKLRDIIKYHPNIKISLILRDPVERIISGFYSLQNRKGAVWNYDEALCHSFFTDVEDYFRALVQENNILEKNKAEYVTVTNRHIRRGYKFYFENVEFIDKNIDKFYYLGSLNNIQNSIEGIMQHPSNFDKLFKSDYKHLHKLKYAFKLGEIEKEFRDKIQDYFKSEYEIYNYLIKNSEKINKKH